MLPARRWQVGIRQKTMGPASKTRAGMPNKLSTAPRTGKDLFDATVSFSKELRTQIWWCVGSTLVVLAALLTLAAIAPWWPLRLAASVVGGLVLVRAFILYHGFMHGSLLSGDTIWPLDTMPPHPALAPTRQPPTPQDIAQVRDSHHLP